MTCQLCNDDGRPCSWCGSAMPANLTSPRFAIRLVHLAVGQRYWAFERLTGYDVEVGLDANGYGSEAEARAAIAAVSP